MTETWRPVPGWLGFYEVSACGKVRSVSRVVPTRRGPREYRGRVLSPSHTTRYESVVMTAPGRKRESAFIHWLVAAAFLGPRPNGLEIRHLDGNGRNNSASNLAYGTRSENAMDRWAHGTMNQPKGEASAAAVLSEEDVTRIRAQAGSARRRELARRYGVHHSTISSVISRKTWAHVE